MRRVLPLLVGIPLLGASVVMSSCASTTTYAAIVNGTVIGRSSLDQELSDISHNKSYVQYIDSNSQTKVEGVSTGSYNKSFVAEVLTNRVEYELVRQELARRNAMPGPPQVDQARALIKQQVASQNQSALFDSFSTRYQDLLAQRQAEVTALQSGVSGQQAFNNLIEKLNQSASIKVSPEFGTFDKKGNAAAGTGPSVIPPPVPNPPTGG